MLKNYTKSHEKLYKIVLKNIQKCNVKYHPTLKGNCVKEYTKIYTIVLKNIQKCIKKYTKLCWNIIQNCVEKLYKIVFKNIQKCRVKYNLTLKRNWVRNINICKNSTTAASPYLKFHIKCVDTHFNTDLGKANLTKQQT